MRAAILSLLAACSLAAQVPAPGGSTGGSGGGSSGTLSQTITQTTSDTLLTTGIWTSQGSNACGNLTTFSGSSLTATLSSAIPLAGACPLAIQNLATTGLTVARNGLLLNGAAVNLALAPGQLVVLYSNGATGWDFNPPAPAVILTTGTTATLFTPYTFNQEATAATAVTYTLPTASAGAQFCIANSYNGSAATTGVLTLATSASGQFIIFTDGTLSATGGNVTSGGAAADASCVVGTDATHWQLYVQAGTWTKH